MPSYRQFLNNLHYSLIAPIYDWMMKLHGNDERRQNLMDMLEIQKGDWIIESGVGTGKNFPFYPLGANYFVIERNKNMRIQAQRALSQIHKPSIRLEEGDSTNLRYSNNKFQKGILTYALSGIPNNELVLTEMERVVEPGGLIGILDFRKTEDDYFFASVSKLDLETLLKNRKRSQIVNKLSFERDVNYFSDNQDIYILEVM